MAAAAPAVWPASQSGQRREGQARLQRRCQLGCVLPWWLGWGGICLQAHSGCWQNLPEGPGVLLALSGRPASSPGVCTQLSALGTAGQAVRPWQSAASGPGGKPLSMTGSYITKSHHKSDSQSSYHTQGRDVPPVLRCSKQVNRKGIVPGRDSLGSSHLGVCLLH